MREYRRVREKDISKTEKHERIEKNHIKNNTSTDNRVHFSFLSGVHVWKKLDKLNPCFGRSHYQEKWGLKFNKTLNYFAAVSCPRS